MSTGRSVNAVASLSARILRCSLTYARWLGVVTFDVGGDCGFQPTTRGRDNFGYRWFCILSRLVWIAFFLFAYWHCRLGKDRFLNMLITIQTVSCLVCNVAVMALQILYTKRAIVVFNRFLRLSQRIRLLCPGKLGFGGVREFGLLLLKLACVSLEIFFRVPELWTAPNLLWFATIVSDVYMLVGALLLLHVSFVGYLCVGAFYAEINGYVARDLQRKLRSLDEDARKSFDGGAYNECCQQRAKAIARRLDECIAIYEEIRCVGFEFQRLIELPLCLTVFSTFSSITMLAYFKITTGVSMTIGIWFLASKMFLDVVLLTLAAHGAADSSRVVRRLGLDSAYMTEDPHWNRKLEVFLNRLNFYEFRVRPLGLFEVSNELILFFISGLVTYMTFIMQCCMQHQRI